MIKAKIRPNPFLSYLLASFVINLPQSLFRDAYFVWGRVILLILMFKLFNENKKSAFIIIKKNEYIFYKLGPL